MHTVGIKSLKNYAITLKKDMVKKQIGEKDIKVDAYVWRKYKK